MSDDTKAFAPPAAASAAESTSPPLKTLSVVLPSEAEAFTELALLAHGLRGLKRGSA
jgi:hypothetical protein